ncbi:MAG: tetratricopeptide repeat protein [Treponema sp.]|jgi:tetratricopeptide (TPR) repeat protein|nr:tetratricopeptide repeat protein [Treponema sp.]
MPLDPVLTKAIRLLRQKKFWEVIHLLEPKIPLYYRSFRCYYLLGLAHLYSNSFGGALDYFKSARDVKMREPNVLLGFAVLYLRRGETDRAVDLYLEVQDVDEKNRIARKALKVIRRHSRTDTMSEWIDSGRLPELYPPIPTVPFSPKSVLLATAWMLGAAFTVFCVLVAVKAVKLPFRLPFQANPDRNGLVSSVLDLGDRREPVQTGGAYRYILTRAQVLNDYEKARGLFTTYNDEKAKVLLNRILESNAADSIKTKATILLSYMDVPGFDTLKDRIPFSDVVKDPLLYRDCYVIWQGMATNLVVEENGTLFDFLVGYDTRSKLEGIIPARFNFSVAVNPEKPLEILGKIIPTEDGKDVNIEGVAVHQRP